MIGTIVFDDLPTLGFKPELGERHDPTSLIYTNSWHWGEYHHPPQTQQSGTANPGEPRSVRNPSHFFFLIHTLALIATHPTLFAFITVDEKEKKENLFSSEGPCRVYRSNAQPIMRLPCVAMWLQHIRFCHSTCISCRPMQPKM